MTCLFSLLTLVVPSGSAAKITLSFQITKEKLFSISENSPSSHTAKSAVTVTLIFQLSACPGICIMHHRKIVQTFLKASSNFCLGNLSRGELPWLAGTPGSTLPLAEERCFLATRPSSPPPGVRYLLTLIAD